MKSDKDHVLELLQDCSGIPQPSTLLCLARIGSYSHGTYVPGLKSIDDVDYMGIIAPPVDHVLGMGKKWESKQIQAGIYDCVFYSFEHFVKLLMKSNPSVLSLLWLPEHCYEVMTVPFSELIKRRDLFSSRAAYNPFYGIVDSHFKKMTDDKKYDGYMGEERKKLVDKFGYDVKDAAHTIRLLLMGIEFLETGNLRVYRDKDTHMLMRIKKGEIKLADVLRVKDRMLTSLTWAYMMSTLPDEIDVEKVNDLVVEINKNLYKIGLAQPML